MYTTLSLTGTSFLQHAYNDWIYDNQKRFSVGLEFVKCLLWNLDLIQIPPDLQKSNLKKNCSEYKIVWAAVICTEPSQDNNWKTFALGSLTLFFWSWNYMYKEYKKKGQVVEKNILGEFHILNFGGIHLYQKVPNGKLGPLFEKILISLCVVMLMSYRTSFKCLRIITVISSF